MRRGVAMGASTSTSSSPAGSAASGSMTSRWKATRWSWAAPGGSPGATTCSSRGSPTPAAPTARSGRRLPPAAQPVRHTRCHAGGVRRRPRARRLRQPLHDRRRLRGQVLRGEGHPDWGDRHHVLRRRGGPDARNGLRHGARHQRPAGGLQPEPGPHRRRPRVGADVPHDERRAGRDLRRRRRRPRPGARRHQHPLRRGHGGEHRLLPDLPVPRRRRVHPRRGGARRRGGRPGRRVRR